MAKKSTASKAVNKSVKKGAKRAASIVVKTSSKQAPRKTVKMASLAIEKSTTRYIRYIPKTIPIGKILCHGGAIPETTDQSPGLNGFRPWYDDDAKSDEYGPCNCGWSGLPHHIPLGWLKHRKEYDARKFPRSRVIASANR